MEGKRGSKTGHVHLGVENAQEPKYVNLKCPVAYAYNVLNFRGWIKLIHDKITLMCSVKNEFNQTSDVQNIGNGAFQNAPFANIPFANGSFPNGGCSCL